MCKNICPPLKINKQLDQIDGYQQSAWKGAKRQSNSFRQFASCTEAGGNRTSTSMSNLGNQNAVHLLIKHWGLNFSELDAILCTVFEIAGH